MNTATEIANPAAGAEAVTPLAASRRGPSALPASIRLIAAQHRSRLIMIGAVAIVAAGQLAEDLADSAPLQMGPPTFYLRRWTVVVAVLYMLWISHIVDRTIEGCLPSLQRLLPLDSAAFQGYGRWMKRADLRWNALFLAIPAVLVLLLFVFVGSDLPTTDPVTHQSTYLPTNVIGAAAVLAGYIVLGWAGLTLVAMTIRRGRALGALSHEHFDVDVFDTAPLLPFGNMALAVALAPAGLIFILLIGFGQPNSWLGWTVVILAALASILALLLPLRGIHRQMARAKQAALTSLSARLMLAYQEAIGPTVGPAASGLLNERTNTVIALRKTVLEMTTWPFRDTVTFGRAVLIASAPLIYAALAQLINVLYINPLRP